MVEPSVYHHGPELPVVPHRDADWPEATVVRPQADNLKAAVAAAASEDSLWDVEMQEIQQQVMCSSMGCSYWSASSDSLVQNENTKPLVVLTIGSSKGKWKIGILMVGSRLEWSRFP